MSQNSSYQIKECVNAMKIDLPQSTIQTSSVSARKWSVT